VVDAPTLVTLGVQLLVSGDGDHDAQVTSRYRRSAHPPGTTACRSFACIPRTSEAAPSPEQFAGSLFELTPARNYQIELHATDADGRSIRPSRDHDDARRAGRSGVADPKSVSDVPGLQARSPRRNRRRDHAGRGHLSGHVRDRGERHRGQSHRDSRASEDGVVLDGRGCSTCNLLEVTGSFVHVERLTLQSAARGCVSRPRARKATWCAACASATYRGITGDPDQRDFYLCDNVLEGRLTWPLVYRTTAAPLGLRRRHQRRRLRARRLPQRADRLRRRVKVEQDGRAPSTSTGNEVLSPTTTPSSWIPARQHRAFRNRFTNTFVPLSFQPVFGGPVYACATWS
jgi:hypothetical protein